eukprot:GHVS01027335.1.p1 GENE.GHVS01027335.1~~GHVS01027335.1.p1  ORF type:complete len:370 (+),score=67.30 GHVS01027335.1:95-1204(+)
MTEFARATEKLTEMKELCEGLLNCPSEELHLKVERYNILSQSVAAFAATIGKYRMQLSETDPDKLYYGPKMLEKIKELVNRYDVLYEVCEDELKPSYDALLRQKLQQQELAKAKALQALEAERAALLLEGRAETQAEMAKREVDLRKQKDEEVAARERAAQVTEESHKRQEQLADRLRLLDEELNEVNNRMEGMKELDKLFFALSHLLQHPPTSSLDAVQSFSDALETLFHSVAEIAKNPDNLASRVYRFWNDLFQKNVASKPSALIVLRVIGFNMVTAKDIQPVLQRLGRSVDVPEDIYLYMKEPDITENYDEWLQWMERMERTKDILGALSSRVRARRLASHSSVGTPLNVEVLSSMLKDFKNEVSN